MADPPADRTLTSAACADAADRHGGRPRLPPADAAATVKGLLHAARSLRERLAERGVDAVASRVVVGGQQLSDRLRACASSSSRPVALRIKVLGGSMTKGAMNGPQLAADLAWPALLKQKLSQALPCSADVSVVAEGGRTIRQALLDFQRSVSPSDDVLITDYTINDGWMSSSDRVARQELDDAMELFVRRVLGLRPGPALLMMESWAELAGRRAMQCAISRSRIAQHYSLPLVSFMRAVCNGSTVNNTAAAERFWLAGCGKTASDSPGIHGGCSKHPGPSTHEIYASLLAFSLIDETRQAACSDSSRERWPQEPLPTPLASEASLSALGACSYPRSWLHVPRDRINVHEGSGLRTRERPPRRPLEQIGWRVYEDRPGKVGLIGNSSVDGNIVSWKLPFTASGNLVVGFLRSYEGQGQALVSAGRNYSDAYAAVLNGTWESRSSQVDVRVLSVAKLMDPADLASYRARAGSDTNTFTAPLRFSVLRPAAGTGRSATGADTVTFKIVDLLTC